MVIWLVLLAMLGAVISWIARNSYWKHISVPTPLRGEALLNPYYAAQNFTQSLGARPERHPVLTDMPGPHDVLVLGSWHWNLLAPRRVRLEQWVQSGGRLVVDRSLIGGVGNFSRWSGIDRLEADEYEEPWGDNGETPDAGRKRRAAQRDEQCRVLAPQGFMLCTFDDGSKLVPLRAASWQLRDEHGPQALRVAVGRGSVTVINAQPFFYRDFLEGDHPRLFVAATQLARGDRVHFVTEQSHPNLLALLWIYAAPAVCLALVWIGLALWRNGVRLGPPLPPTATTRRSLGEQIRGTGQFMLRFGSGSALQRAQARALDEAASRRISGYAALSVDERAREIARLAHVEPDGLSAAFQQAGRLRPAQLRGAIELLETARRRILQTGKGL
jgi:hypothetical protein